MAVGIKHARWIDPEAGRFVIEGVICDVAWLIAVYGDTCHKAYRAEVYQFVNEDQAQESIALIIDGGVIPHALLSLGSAGTGEILPAAIMDMTTYPKVQSGPFPAGAVDLAVTLINKAEEEHGSPIVAGRKRTIINIGRKEHNVLCN